MRRDVEVKRRKAYKVMMKPAMITLFFYWGALFLYSAYQYVTASVLGTPFYILNIGVILFGISSLIYIKIEK